LQIMKSFFDLYKKIPKKHLYLEGKIDKRLEKK